jgi:hypothetical protein
MNVQLFCVAHRQPSVQLPEGVCTLGVNDYKSATYFTGSGNNINEKNSRYSEVSAIYWLLNNPCAAFEQADFVGICHYRRFFYSSDVQASVRPGSASIQNEQFSLIRNSCSAKSLGIYLKDSDCIAPQPIDLRRPLLQFYNEKHLQAGRDLTLAYDEGVARGLWTQAFSEEQLHRETKLSPFCMSVLRKDNFITLWTAIIEALLAIEPQVSQPRDAYQQRNMGFIAERLHSSAVAWQESQGMPVQRLTVVQVG